jgi:hypothetical protein
MSRIFDHTKQYSCTEVFRLEELQTLIEELENIDDDDIAFCVHRKECPPIQHIIADAKSRIEEFLNNIIEQEKRK